MVSKNNEKEHSILGLVISGLEYLLVLLKDHRKVLEESDDENGTSEM